MGSSVYLFNQSKKVVKCQKYHCIFLAICLAALVTSGVALKCIQCSGSNGLCGEDEEGTSGVCPSNTIACVKGQCETLLFRYCGVPALEPTENSIDIMFDTKLDECRDDSYNGEDCTVCACDTDDCNGASMTQISTIGFIGVVLLSFLNQ